MLTNATYTPGLPTSVNFLVQNDKRNYDLNDALLISPKYDSNATIAVERNLENTKKSLIPKNYMPY
jgi:hypothetical protein